MRILHVGLCVDGKNEGLPFALKEVSDFYYELRPDKGRDQQIISAASNHQFDLAFFQIQTPDVILPSTFKYLNEIGVFTINWSGDMRNGTPRWYYDTGASLTLFSNVQDVQNLRNAGLKSDFLQIGIDPKVYKKWISSEKGNDIVYMGNNYRNQFPESQRRIDMTKFLKNHFGNRFSLYGNGWDHTDGENNPNQVLQSKIYNNSKIGINYSQFNSDRYTSDRLFRILASGCFCLSHNYKGIEKDFKIGRHLDVFNDFNELKDKINYYLSNEEERKRIAQSGYEYCQFNFSYKAMVKNLIKLYNQYK